MHKILLIAAREFKNRVQKKSFLIATILLPLIFPSLIAILGYLSTEQDKSASRKLIRYIDESHRFKPDTTQFAFTEFDGSLADAKEVVNHDQSMGLLYIPDTDLFHPHGITLYTKQSLTPKDQSSIERMIKEQLKERRMQALNIAPGVLDSINNGVYINNILIDETGKEQASDTDVLFYVGMIAGILMYMFIFIYGAQIMQGIIEEKTSKVVEVIVSSVKPFQLMMGKILGLASVGLLQFLIWIVLISVLSTGVLALFGIHIPHEEMLTQAQQNREIPEFVKTVSQIPFTYVALTFLFYFLGGYLIYGALFAAIGSAVDSPAEAQQFIFPVTLPMLISYMSLFSFVLRTPHGAVSIWLSMIPFTSPIAMMGRIAFKIPGWQLALSMILLIAGFILTTWVAARIYRVGILMHGTKVNYRVLIRWFLMKH